VINRETRPGLSLLTAEGVRGLRENNSYVFIDKMIKRAGGGSGGDMEKAVADVNLNAVITRGTFVKR